MTPSSLGHGTDISLRCMTLASSHLLSEGPDPGHQQLRCSVSLLLTHTPVSSRARAHRLSGTAEISCRTARHMCSTPQQDSACSLNCPEAVSYSGPGAVLGNDAVRRETGDEWAAAPPPALLLPTAWVRRLEGAEPRDSRGDSRGGSRGDSRGKGTAEGTARGQPRAVSGRCRCRAPVPPPAGPGAPRRPGQRPRRLLDLPAAPAFLHFTN